MYFALNHQAAILTAVSGCVRSLSSYFFKIITLYAACLEALRAIAAAEIVRFDCQVTVPAPQHILFFRQKNQCNVFA
jgi:hypothetical protein